MTTLIFAMMWRRRAQAAALAVLALLAVAASVAAPAYLRASDRAVAAGQVETAGANDRGLLLARTENDRRGATTGTGLSFTTVGPALAAFPGFIPTYAAEFAAFGMEPDPVHRSRMVHRQDVCAHLTMATGRCASGADEIVVGVRTAERLELAAGDVVGLAYATFASEKAEPVYQADGDTRQLTITGTYTVPDPSAAYWGTHGYFAADPGNRPGEPVFTTGATLALMDRGATMKSVDSIAGPGALDVDRLEGIRAALAALDAETVKLGSTIGVRTGLPDLLERVDSGRAAARQIVPVVAVPLVVLSCFVIFLAAGFGAEARRPEVAVVALRGVRWWERWWLATGENLVAILAGAVAGCLAGQLLITMMAALLFPGVGAGAGLGALAWAPAAALAALLSALLAQRRQLFEPVAALLRRVTGARRRPPVLEIVVVLLAVVTGAQLTISGSPTGAGVFAAALIIFAAALVLARAVLPLVAVVASRALRRGRVDTALAGLQLARRPGAAGLFALLVAVSGVAAYAACSIGSGARDRAVIAELGTGADRVVSVGPVPPYVLLDAVRAVDPEGRFAMAAVHVTGNRSGQPAGLAVDSERLATVANWRAGGPGAAEVAAALRPQVAAPVVITGRDLTVELTASDLPVGRPVKLIVALTSLAGNGSTQVDLGALYNGPGEYTQRVAMCTDGCRLDGIEIAAPGASGAITGRLELTGIGTINPVRAALPVAELADPDRWYLPRYGTVTGGTDALVVELQAPNGLGTNGALLQPADTPEALPVAVAGPASNTFIGLDGEDRALDKVAQLHALPQLGVFGLLTDLEYADRATARGSSGTDPEVWLTDAAPDDVLDQLTARGLVVLDDVRAADVREQADRQGPALALWFHALAAVLAVLLGAGALLLAASVDRARRVEDLSALRVQGLGRAAAGRASLYAYPLLVLVAVPAGTGAGLLGYGLSGWSLPLAGLVPPPLPLPIWPHWWVVVLVALAVLAVLAGTAVLAGRDLRRRIG